MEFLYILSAVMERSSITVTFDDQCEAPYMTYLHTMHSVLNLAKLRNYLSNTQTSHKIVYFLDKKL